MKMGARRHTLEMSAVADFVQRAYTHVESRPAPKEEPSRKNEQQALAGELDKALGQAREQNNTPLEKTLKDLRGVLGNLNTLSKTLYPQVLKQFEAAREKLLQQDFLGNARPKLPAAFEKALGFLRESGQGNVAGKTRPGTPSKAESTPGAATARSEGAAKTADTQAPSTLNTLAEGRRSRVDSKVGEFVKKYYRDGFEQKGPNISQREILDSLPADQRKVLDGLPQQEREFLLTMDDRFRPVYAGMDAKEQGFFRSLRPGERSQYLGMGPEEKQFLGELSPDERGTYMSLHPEQRELVRQTRDPRAALSGQARALLSALDTKDPTKLAGAVGQDLAGLLGEPAPQDAEAHDTLRREASALTLNYFKENGGNLAAAKTQALRTLLSTPLFAHKLLGGLETALQQRQAQLGRGNLYVSHFQKIRSTVPDFAQKLAYPAISHDELFGGLLDAIEVSAEFQAANPPRRRHLRASEHVAFEGRHIAG